MLDAARRAVTLAGGRSRDALSADETFQLALARLVEIVGEASRQISEGMKDSHPEIPRAEIRGTRNRLVRAYFDVNLDAMWEIVGQDLPRLIVHLERILSAAPGPSGAR
jgi:uncharacterized protein with HEPN domain